MTTDTASAAGAAGYKSVQDWYAAVKAANSSSSTSAASAAGDQETRFLKLLTTQLRNQDPMNPMDNAQTTSQLAQISTVTGIEKLNKTLNTMMSSNQSAETMQAANMVGHSVLLDGNHLKLASGAAVGGVDLDKPASSVTVSIYDSTGKKVQTLDLGAQEAGVNEFLWDGKNADGTTLADGSYTVKVEAKDKEGAVTATALELATVTGVINTDSGLKLDVGRLGRVSVGDIKIIL